MKLLMIVNEDRFFLSHRKEVALAAQKAGWEVVVVCKDTGQRKEVEALGLKMLELPVNPTGMNPIQEFRTWRFLHKLYRKNRDAVVHHVGLKNILWGGLAAKMTRVHGVVNAVSGLGAIFSNDKMGTTTRGILSVMRFSNKRKNVKVIFQNQEDKALFLRHGVVDESQIEFIKGSGVDLNEFRYVAEPESETLKVVFTARMVKEKGVMELIEAAERLRKDYEGKVEFWAAWLTMPMPFRGKNWKPFAMAGISSGLISKKTSSLYWSNATSWRSQAITAKVSPSRSSTSVPSAGLSSPPTPSAAKTWLTMASMAFWFPSETARPWPKNCAS